MPTGLSLCAEFGKQVSLKCCNKVQILSNNRRHSLFSYILNTISYTIGSSVRNFRGRPTLNVYRSSKMFQHIQNSDTAYFLKSFPNIILVPPQRHSDGPEGDLGRSDSRDSTAIECRVSCHEHLSACRPNWLTMPSVRPTKTPPTVGTSRHSLARSAAGSTRPSTLAPP